MPERNALLVLAGCMGVAGVVGWMPGAGVAVLNTIGLGSLVALGLVLLTGIAGQTSFAQAAFVGVGAYLSAIGTTRWGLSPWLTLGLALVVTLCCAWLIGQISLRMRGHFLPLGTIAWAVAVYHLFGTLPGLGGYSGLGGVPSLSVGGHALQGERAMLALILPVLLLALWVTRNLLDSRPGRSIRCLRARADMLESFGVAPTALRVRVFMLAAALACVAGWLTVHLRHFVNPTPFSLNMGIEYLFMAVIGGAGGVGAAVAGAAAVVLLREALQRLVPGVLGQGGAAEMILFGLLVVLLLQRARGGIWPWLSRPWVQRPGPAHPAAMTEGADATDRAGVMDRAGVRHTVSEPNGPAAKFAAVRPPAEAAQGGSPVQSAPLLVVSGLRKTFGGVAAVDDVNLELEPGTILGLIGPNGAGKSTLFNLISGHVRPDGGAVLLGGRAVQGRGPVAVARGGVARTFQHVQLLDGSSVLANVAIGASARGEAGWLRSALRLDRREEAALRADALRQLARVNLAHLAEQPCGSLALGQQRLVEIARALCAHPKLLLLDEPAAGLRHGEKQALAALLRQLRAEGMAVLVVEHDMDFVMGLCDRLVVMRAGQRIAAGTPAEVSRDPLVREAYLGSSAADGAADGAAGHAAVGRRAAAVSAAVSAALPASSPASAAGPAAVPALQVQNLRVSHGRVQAVHGIYLELPAAGVLTLIGPNGAGKSTTLAALMGLLPCEGRVLLHGQDLSGMRVEERVALGLSLVPERRELFADMSVQDNLLLGATRLGRRLRAVGDGRNGARIRTPSASRSIQAGLDEVYARFPRLLERRRQMAGTLSGGERQMLALGRALMSRPRVLLLDEPSLGLAPRIVADILDGLASLRADGVAVLLVEQNARAALAVADLGHVIERGRIVLSGRPDELTANDDLVASYLGARAVKAATDSPSAMETSR